MRWNDENPRFRDVRVKGLVLLHETERAVLVIEADTMEACRASGDSSKPFQKWVPKSQIRASSPPLASVDRGDEVEVVIPKWLADAKEFMYE